MRMIRENFFGEVTFELNHPRYPTTAPGKELGSFPRRGNVGGTEGRNDLNYQVGF